VDSRIAHERSLAAKERRLVEWERQRSEVHDCNEPIHRRAMQRHVEAAALHDRVADYLERQRFFRSEAFDGRLR
jgi:hypothetical protein